MNKQEFLEAFMNYFNDIPDDERRLIYDYYDELICDWTDSGLSESECIEKLGSPKEAAKRFRCEYECECGPKCKTKEIYSNSFLPENPDVHTLDLTAKNTKIEVSAYDVANLQITAEQNPERTSITNFCKDGVWYFEQTVRKSRLWFLGEKSFKISVFVPKNFTGSLFIKSSNAPVSLSNCKSLSNIVLTTCNSPAEILETNAHSFTIETSNAPIKAVGLSGGTLSAATSNSKVTAESCTFSQEITLSTSNAGIRVENISSDNISLQTSNSSIIGFVSGDIREYRTIGATSNASCNIPTLSYPDQTKTFSAATSNGKIKVDFIQNI